MLYMFFYALLALLPVLGTYLPDSSFKYHLAAAGNIWLGFYMYFTGLLLILQLLRLIRRLFARSMTSARSSRIILSLVIAFTLCLNAYGCVNAQNVTTTRYNIDINKSAGSVQTLKIALIADFHLGVNSNRGMYRKMVSKINKMDPDVIIVDGDIFNSTYSALKDPQAYAAILSGLHARYGVYAVYGNHDVDESLFGGFAITSLARSFRNPRVTSFMRSCGFTILDDETVTLAGGNIILAGRRDGEKAGDGTRNRMSAAALLSGTDKTRPVIVAEHEPLDFSALNKAGADLVLSGHTHDGQIFPGNFITRILSENSYGIKKISGVISLVTSGVGYYGPPMRIGTHSEIAEINIRFKR
jgi:predicted MPP superfamily phosphohydrolase